MRRNTLLSGVLLLTAPFIHVPPVESQQSPEGAFISFMGDIDDQQSWHLSNFAIQNESFRTAWAPRPRPPRTLRTGFRRCRGATQPADPFRPLRGGHAGGAWPWRDLVVL